MRTLIYLLNLKKLNHYLKKSFYIFISLIFIYSCNKNKKDNSNTIIIENKIDSINVFNKQLNYDTIIRNKLIIQANDYYKNNQLVEYYKIYKKIENNSTSIKDTFGIIYAKINLGYYFSSKFYNDSSYYYFSRAEKLSRKTKNNPFLATILVNKADILWGQKNYSEAEVIAIKALKKAIGKKRYDLEYSCYITIANSLEGMNKNEKAIDYYKKALQVLEENNIEDKPSYISQTYNYLAKIHQKQSQHQKAIFYINKGFENKRLKENDPKIYCYLSNTLAYSKFKLGDKNAINLCNETLKIADSIQFDPIKITSQTYLAEMYLAQKDTATAINFLDKAEKLAHKNSIFEDELHILKLQQKANPKNKEFYSQRYITLNDSLQTVERATRDKFARIEFETDEISSEKDKVEKLYENLNTQFLLLLGLSIFLLTSLYLWYKNKANKTSLNELKLKQDKQEADEKVYQLLLNQEDVIEETKQFERNRIAKELHDGIMGKLSGIRMNLYIIKKKTDTETIATCLKYINDIKEIENNLRLLSHDLNKNIFSTATTMEDEINVLFKDIKNHNKLLFELKIHPEINWENISNKIKINIYRIIQEALHNIDKYAKAKNVYINIFKKDASIVVEIIDNGIGFTVLKSNQGIGIKNMEQRTYEIGGKFTINSEPKNGTKIILIIPN